MRLSQSSWKTATGFNAFWRLGNFLNLSINFSFFELNVLFKLCLSALDGLLHLIKNYINILSLIHTHNSVLIFFPGIRTIIIKN